MSHQGVPGSSTLQMQLPVPRLRKPLLQLQPSRLALTFRSRAVVTSKLQLGHCGHHTMNTFLMRPVSHLEGTQVLEGLPRGGCLIHNTHNPVTIVPPKKTLSLPHPYTPHPPKADTQFASVIHSKGSDPCCYCLFVPASVITLQEGCVKWRG